MWAFIIMTLVGVVLSIANANAWFIVPDYCITICFVIAVVLFIVWLISYIGARRTVSKMSRRF